MSDFNINDFSDLADIIASNKDSLKDVTASSNSGGDFAPLPNGYYLCKLEEMNLVRTKTSNKPMVSAKFRITQNGYTKNTDGKIAEIEHVANRLIFQNWVIKTKLEDPEAKSYKNFKADCLKLVERELDEDQLDQFSELLDDLSTLPAVFDALIGYEIYIQVVNKADKDDPSKINSNSYLVEWSRVNTLLGLDD